MKKLLALFTLTALLAGCGGGSSESENPVVSESAALSIPSSINIVQADESSSNSALSAGLNDAFNALNTDYSNSEQNFWIRTEGDEALEEVNMILDFLSQMNWENHIDKGPYIALVSEKQEKEGSASDSTSDSSSVAEEKYMDFIVDVESDNEKVIVNVWVENLIDPEDGVNDTPHSVFAKSIIEKGISDEYPYGKFVLYVKDAESDGTTSWKEILSVDKGEALSTDTDIGKVRIKYKSWSEDGWNSEMYLLASADVSQGAAYTTDSVWDSVTSGPVSKSYRIAFNDRYVKAQNITDSLPANIYDQDQYTYKIYNYGLYKATDGSKVGRNSGVSLNIEADGKTYYGYAGYWGLWVEDGVDLSAATITDNNDNVYTIFEAPGRLTKHTKYTITLSELDGVEMSMWSENGDIIIAWDDENNVFNKLAVVSWSDSGYNRVDLETPVALGASDFNEWSNAWVRSISASIPVGRLYKNQGEVASILPTGETGLAYSSQETVAPGSLSEDLTLIQYGDTKYLGKVDIASLSTANNVTTSTKVVENIDYSDVNFDWDSITLNDYKNEYFFDKDTMTLYSGTSKVAGKELVLASDITESSISKATWKLRYGLDIYGAIDGSDSMHSDGTITTDNRWQAQDKAQTYYSWRAGLDSWYKPKTLKDSGGSFVEFDQPLQFTYKHLTENDRDKSSKHNDKKFMIDYDGKRLNVPWEYNEEHDTWTPQFSLNDGVIINPEEEIEYVVKALEGQQMMKKVASVADGYTEPEFNTSISDSGLVLSDVDSIDFKEIPLTDQNGNKLVVKVIKGMEQE